MREPSACIPPARVPAEDADGGRVDMTGGAVMTVLGPAPAAEFGMADGLAPIPRSVA